MAVLKRMINNVRVENNFTPMSAILAERLLIYVAKGNFLGLHFQNHAFAQRDNFGNEIKVGEEFLYEDKLQAMQIANTVNPSLNEQSDLNMVNYCIDIAT